MISIDWTLGASALIFLITLFGMNRLLFRPLFRTLDERQAKTTDVFDMAGSNEDHYRSLVDQYEEKIKAQKQAGYRHAEALRDEALKERQAKIAEARRVAEGLTEDAKSRIQGEMERARRNLKGEVEEIAALISSRIVQGG